MSKFTKGAVTVVFPNYNHAKFLQESLGNILKQRRPADKIILFDDASTDNSVSVIQEMIKNHDNVTFIVHEKNKGCVASLNEGLQLVETEYVTFLGADDRLDLQFLEKCLPLLDAHPEAGFCSGACSIIDGNGNVTGRRPVFPLAMKPAFISKEKVKSILKTMDNFFWGNTAIYRAEHLLQLNGFNQDLHSLSDGMAMRVLALKQGACYMPESLAAWRFLGNNMSVVNATEHEKLESLIAKANAFIATQDKTLFPKNYAKLLENRMRFGAARVQIAMAKQFGKTELMQLHQALNTPIKCQHMFRALSNLPLRMQKFFMMAYVFLKTRPFGMFAMMRAFALR